MPTTHHYCPHCGMTSTTRTRHTDRAADAVRFVERQICSAETEVARLRRKACDLPGNTVAERQLESAEESLGHLRTILATINPS